MECWQFSDDVLWQSEASLAQRAQQSGLHVALVAMGMAGGVKGFFEAVKTGRGEFANSLIVRDVLHYRFFQIFLGHWGFFLNERGFYIEAKTGTFVDSPYFRFITLLIYFSGQVFCNWGFDLFIFLSSKRDICTLTNC